MSRAMGLWIVGVVLICVGCAAADATPPQPVTRPGAFGYLDAAGGWAIPPRFEDASDFRHGTARVTVDGKQGYIDTQGQFIVPPEYDDIGSWADGLLLARRNKQIGYLAPDHSVSIPPQFEDGAEFVDGLARVRRGGRWGFIDHHGSFVIAPQFDAAHDFSEDRARVIVNGKAGYIDRAGRMAIAPQFSIESNDYGADDFRDGLAMIATRRGQGWRIGYLDQNGNFKIPASYPDAYRFSEGLAAVQAKTFRLLLGGQVYLYGFIDRDGAMPIAAQFVARPNSFSDGLALVQIDNKRGYIDRSGHMVLPAAFNDAGDFHFGLALVRLDQPLHVYIDKQGQVQSDGIALYNYEGWVADYPSRQLPDGLERMQARVADQMRYGFRDAAGNIRIAPQFTFALPFSEGLAKVQRADGSWACIDRRGAEVHAEPANGAQLAQAMRRLHAGNNQAQPYTLQTQDGRLIGGAYNYLGIYSEGLARARRTAFAVGYADEYGQLVISARYDEALPFEGHIARVREEQLWGLIDLQGNYVLAPRFHSVRPFAEDRAAVAVGAGSDAKWGYVDSGGRVVIEPQFDEAGEFSEGLALARLHQLGTGFIDQAGRWAVRPQFYEARPFREGRAAVHVLVTADQVGKWGYIDHRGRLLIPARFTRAGDFENGVAAVYEGDAALLIDSGGNPVEAKR